MVLAPLAGSGSLASAAVKPETASANPQLAATVGRGRFFKGAMERLCGSLLPSSA